MTDWKTVQGSQAERPAEFDSATSSVIVYQRRNIKSVTVTNSDGSETELWQYEERELTRGEYETAEIERNRSDIDYIAAMSEIEL